MADGRWKIVVAEAYSSDAVERLRAVGEVTILEACDEKALQAAVSDCDALLVRTYAQVTRAVVEQARRLRVIGRGGVGLENIDLAAARERGIMVVYTPAAATEAVADLTVGMLIALVRNVVANDAGVRAGRFEPLRRTAVSRDLSDLTLGIIGMGRIGQAVARRCYRGFGMSILYNDIVDPGWLEFVTTRVAKEELYRQADVVSLHVPLTTETRHLINKETLAQFKPGAYLINTARGAVVDEAALALALSSGALAGVALDVFEQEPLSVDDVLTKAPNVLLSPHVAARTDRGLARMNDVVDDVIRVLEGRPPEYPA